MLTATFGASYIRSLLIQISLCVCVCVCVFVCFQPFLLFCHFDLLIWDPEKSLRVRHKKESENKSPSFSFF